MADQEMAGARQLDRLLSDETLPWHEQLCVDVGDTRYSKPAYLQANRHHENLVTIARVRRNRTFYRQPPARKQPSRGRPRWYGDRFSLKDPAGWQPPDETRVTTHRSRRGRQYQVHIQAWHNLLMRGKQKPRRLPMHQHPLTLVRICSVDADGRPVHKRPLWLIVVGQRRQEIELLHIYQTYYLHRSHLEHFFRFARQKLLLTRFQTPEVRREETWWRLVHLAHAQLWVARPLVQHLPRPWERYLPSAKARLSTPTLVQRDFGRIMRQLGTPARPPKPRGNSPGRRQGARLRPPIRYQVFVNA
jgi:hypothetical protein